ncbi:hypothetical protein ACFQ0B_36160 [Nonomuraea thailandensis]
MERVHLGEWGHAAEALEAEREAIAIYRRLAAGSPGPACPSSPPA